MPCCFTPKEKGALVDFATATSSTEGKMNTWLISIPRPTTLDPAVALLHSLSGLTFDRLEEAYAW